MSRADVGVIGGTGLYQLDGLSDVRDISVDTPFGASSAPVTLGSLGGVRLAFLPRHGIGHRLTPSEVPVKANIYALKSLGVERIVSVSAVGSLREEIRPLDVVVPNQLIDRTKLRASTFFGNGAVGHIAFAEPFCPDLSRALVVAAEETQGAVHDGGTYVVIEGPAFSTKAESLLYRSWKASVIGMTALPEAKLAREAEICYATLALATDYDTWHEEEEAVSVSVVAANLGKNVARSKEILRRLIGRIPGDRSCQCATALKDAVITSRDHISEGAKRDLWPLIGKYFQ